jgi:membrane protease YdiL (CAAX protease family)
MAEPAPYYRYVVMALLVVATPPLLAIPEYKFVGWLILAAAAGLALVWHRTRFAHHALLLCGMLALLGIIPINTDISYVHMLTMGGVLIATVAVPYLVTRFVTNDGVITFPFRFGRMWRKREIAYVFLAGVVSYLLLPFYLATTGSYLNWRADIGVSEIIRLFIGTNALGIWDELFFVGVCLALLRQHMPFIWANLVQASLWTTFLFELGFRGWGPPLIFAFALSQGYIFSRSKSLLYIITVHLTIDFMLFLTLIHLHNPHLLRIFISSPF